MRGLTMASESDRERQLVAAVLLSVVVLGLIILFLAPSGEVAANLSLDDNGRTIFVRAGEMVNITVPENHSTGYKWQYYENKSCVQVVDEVYTPYKVPPVPGGGGTLMLRQGYCEWEIHYGLSSTLGEQVDYSLLGDF
jgi:predicted secreted protein